MYLLDTNIISYWMRGDPQLINKIKSYRTRYFTDSGIIGSKEFVATNYQRFKHLFYSRHEKKPRPIKGLEGMYSLKRLSESI